MGEQSRSEARHRAWRWTERTPVNDLDIVDIGVELRMSRYAKLQALDGAIDDCEGVYG